MSKHGLALAIALASASVVATQVSAFPEAAKTVKSASVSYADLDLSSPRGAQSIIHRIRNTADRLCGPAPSTVWWADYKDYRRCVKEAESGAVRRLGSPVVTALYEGRGSGIALAANDGR